MDFILRAGTLGQREGLEALDTLPGYRHHDMHQILESVKQGCPLCDIILRRGWEHPHNKTSSEPHVQLSEEVKSRPLYFVSRGARERSPPLLTWYTAEDWEGRIRDGLGDRVWLDGGQVTRKKPPQVTEERWVWNSWISIAVMAPFDDPAAKHFFHRPMQASFLDGDIMQEAKKWLDDCMGGCHEGCVPPMKSQLPTRVLDVDTNLGSIVCLQEQNTGILESRLGIRYLWIDALCIIQDSPEDKLSEISKMGTIYRNAVITIAAAHSRKASDGFLKVSTHYAPEYVCKMPVHLPGNPRVGTVTLAPEHSLPGTTRPEALRTRGWAFQEAVLSRRLLIFSGYDLQCHCNPEHARLLNLGNLYTPRSPKLYAFGAKHFDLFETHHKTHGDGWMSANFLAEMWNAMLGEFTSRSLTVADDRLHALQGIANELLQSKHLATNMDRTYVVGTWMACLPSQLVWSRDNRTALCPDNGNLPFQPITSRSKRAPTWSWACLDSPIMFLSVETDSGKPYKGLSLLHVSSESDGLQLEAECDVLCRSLDEFRHDSSKAQGIRINLDLDVDELPPAATCVHYHSSGQVHKCGRY
ncbi:HET domain-containing protein [Fusarium sp. LHS14.1]|nr:HET domain-containing protein [Fusarium sp. LHS14.1]